MLSTVNSSEAQHGVYPASKLSNWGLTRDLFGAWAANKAKPREDWGGDPKTTCMGGGGGGKGGDAFFGGVGKGGFTAIDYLSILIC